MRLFIAVNFNDEIKQSLCNTIEELKSCAIKGNFTRRENLHLTLAFLGETNKMNLVKQAMDEVNGSTFSLNIKGFGKFKRDGGNLYWIGAEKCEELFDIQQQLCEKLSFLGFVMEKREFKPHLTLGREVLVPPDFNEKQFSQSIPGMSMNVKHISLMKSERINGKLTYTEIYSKQLKE